MIPSVWLDQAERRLTGLIEQTPLTYDPTFDLYIKWENRQITGSFKIRGALNKVLSLENWEQQRGLVAASAGNHGQGVAIAGNKVGAPVTVFTPHLAVPAKLDAIRGLGAEVRLVEGGYEDVELAGQTFATENGMTWVSPYNDGQVIAGQATLGRELLRQMPDLGTVIVPVGGGGLAAGVGAALAECSARPALVGVQSEASPFFYNIFHRGTQEGVKELPSLADGLAGAVEIGSLTIPMVRRLMEAFVLVREDQIRRAIVYAWVQHGEKIEGSGAAALAAAMFMIKSMPARRPVVAVVSGGNIQPEIHAEMVREDVDRKEVAG
jgi:threonine dehydratase